MARGSVAEQLLSYLAEDVGSGDLTSSFTPNRRVTAVLRSNSAGILAGSYEAGVLLRKIGVKAVFHMKDGSYFGAESKIATLDGPARKVLSLERTLLNIMSRMSGVATLTRKYVDAVAGYKVCIAATRKTSPGFRLFDKRAVVVGGGVSHRIGLYDMVLIKDNHLAVFGGDIDSAVAAARKKAKGFKVEVEASSLAEAVSAAKAGADMILLDNMTPSQVRKTVSVLEKAGMREKVLVEASGGIRLGNVKNYARAGVDWISLGELTRSAKGLDFGLDVVKVH